MHNIKHHDKTSKIMYNELKNNGLDLNIHMCDVSKNKTLYNPNKKREWSSRLQIQPVFLPFTLLNLFREILSKNKSPAARSMLSGGTC